MLAGASLDVRHVRVAESVDTSLFAGDADMDDLGWGRPLGSPGHAEDVERAVKVFADGVDVLARMLGVDPQIRAKVDIWPDQDLSRLTPEAIHAIGMRITGVPVVNAIPAVVSSAAGVVTDADLPLVTGAIWPWSSSRRSC